MAKTVININPSNKGQSMDQRRLKRRKREAVNLEATSTKSKAMTKTQLYTKRAWSGMQEESLRLKC